MRPAFYTLLIAAIYMGVGTLEACAGEPKETTVPHSLKPPLVKLPVNFGHTAESTPVIFHGTPLLVLNYHDDTLLDTEQRARAMYLYITDLNTGRQVAKFGEGYTFVSAFVAKATLHVFASNEREKAIYRFSSSDLKSWTCDLAIPAVHGEHLFNSSVCEDDQGYLMAYESDKPTHYCVKFARSQDLKTWRKVEGHVFAGLQGTQYSACPVIRRVKPYYYMIYLHAPLPNRNGWLSFMARSRNLSDWQLSPLNPILEAGDGEGCNNSDVDLFEWEGNTYIFYANGDQQTWFSLRMAMYPGPMGRFFEACFPEKTRTVDVSARYAQPTQEMQGKP